jgi:hypothetical protein
MGRRFFQPLFDSYLTVTRLSEDAPHRSRSLISH